MRLPCRGGSLSPGPAPACGKDPQEGGGAGEVSRLGDCQFLQVPSRGVWPGEQVLGQEQPPRERDLESLWAGRVHREAQQTQTFFLKNLLLPPRENPVSGK